MKTTYYKETVRLMVVAEQPEKNRRYRLEPLGNEEFDVEFDVNDLDRMLQSATEKVFGLQRFYRIDHSTDFDGHDLVIETHDGSMTFEDIRAKIDGIGDDPGFFCVFPMGSETPRWIVSVLVKLELRGSQ